ncbi:hypothetical protein OsI_12086 [Oryza sativa Indica Group]|uniref:Uncharacterized protein n=1 Tax=Oryza sativa subsp. indica TaxID=39946 RepID=A2XI35_ORYSI|nr:hypothetical protein OsI_12086 [Oryza sativa Indica Group]
MLVPEAELPVQAAAAAAPIDWMWYTVHLTVEEIERITARVEAVTTALDAIRPALDMAVGLLGEDIYAAEILDDYMLAALVPAGAGQAPLPDATLDAAARTFATVSSGAPLLPGSILDVGNLISAAYDIVDQPPPDAPTPDGLLNDAITDLQAAFADGGLLTNVRNSTTAPPQQANYFATDALAMLNVVAWEAMDAMELIRSHCLVPWPERNEHMRELERCLLTAIKYIDKAIAAVGLVHGEVELMDQTLRQAIHDANIPANGWA